MYWRLALTAVVVAGTVSALAPASTALAADRRLPVVRADNPNPAAAHLVYVRDRDGGRSRNGDRGRRYYDRGDGGRYYYSQPYFYYGYPDYYYYSSPYPYSYYYPVPRYRHHFLFFRW
jgi:hypothetical protein